MYQVIIVDDEPRILEGIIHLFPWNNFGFEVVASFTNGKEALEYINAHPQVDIVMTDIQMPVMDGLQTARAYPCFHPYRRTWNPHYCRQYQNTAGGYCSSQKCRNQRVSFQTAASKSIVPHHEKLFIDSVIHQSTVLLAGFLLYFTILGNSFWQKRFLNLFFKNATLFL